MNFYKKYKSNIIAVLFTVIINGFIVSLLFLIPMQSNNSDEDFSILLQNELLGEDTPPPPPVLPNTEIKTKKSTKEHGKESANENPVKEVTNTVENYQNSSPNPESVDVKEEKDSALMSDLQQMLQQIQTIAPKDSLPEQEVVEKKQTAQDILIQDKRRYDDDRKFYRANYATIRNLKIIYPYVMQTKQIVDKLNLQLSTIKDKREKQRLIKKMEKELFDQFEKDVRKMSTSQGALLLKLIARETNQSGYNIIKNYKGTLPATFWYGVGKLFRENLKTQYDSIGQDAALEKVVIKYKQGKF
jgi:hypothetical protein